MNAAFVAAIVLFVVALNIGATYRIRTDEYLDARQRMGMTIFVWIVPILGAMFIYHFRGDEEQSGKFKDNDSEGDELEESELPGIPEHHDYPEVGPEHD